jgi:plastocyanin
MIPGSENFDSRALHYTDCYGQRFMKAGRYSYNALATVAQICNDERPYVVNVKDRGDDTKMNQVTVCLTWDDRGFVPDHAEVEIGTGDLVLWHCPQPATPGYSVVGAKGFFSSAALASECGYSHAFCQQGTYEWGDALGSRVGGTIVVTDPKVDTDAGMARWKKTLSRGGLVMVADGKAEPASVEIVTGQTVYFAVVRGPITVTDRRLIPAQRTDAQPKRKAPTKKTS